MKENNLLLKTSSNLLWRFAERFGATGVSFVVSMVLARLLAPEDYGLIALVTVFITILNVFVDAGLGSALIQKKDADDLDFSTVFYFNVVFCLLLYSLLYVCAPFIAQFYSKSELTAIIRVLGLTIIISGVKGVQQAYVSKNLMFKKFFFATLCGTLGAAVLGIVMAVKGFGVWALVCQSLFNTTVDTIILWASIKWRPKKMFSLNRLKRLFSYGWKLLASSLINTVYEDLRQLIIGKVYSAESLAFYNKGQQLPNMIVQNINTSIDSVLLPVMSSYQDEQQQLKAMTRRAIITSSFFMWPLTLGLAATGENLITLLLTEKWLPCVPYLYIFCFVYGLQPIHTANLNAIKSMGRSDLYLKMEVFKKVVGIGIILVSMNYGVLAIGIGTGVYALFAGVVNAFPNRKLLEYRFSEQMKDLLPPFMLALVMAVAVYFLPVKTLPIFVQLLIQVPVGAVIYIVGSALFKLEGYVYAKRILTTLLSRKKNAAE